MGQHKYNPTAIAAKEGKIPPKPPKLSKKQRDFMVFNAVENAMRKTIGMAPSDLTNMYTDGKMY